MVHEVGRMHEETITPFASPTIPTEPVPSQTVQPELTLADLPEDCITATGDATVTPAEPPLVLNHFAFVARLKHCFFFLAIVLLLVMIDFLLNASGGIRFEKWMTLPIVLLLSPFLAFFSLKRVPVKFDNRLAKRLQSCRNLSKADRQKVDLKQDFVVVEQFHDAKQWPNAQTMFDAGLIFWDEQKGLILEGALYRFHVPCEAFYFCEVVESKRWLNKVKMVRVIVRKEGTPHEIFLRPCQAHFWGTTQKKEQAAIQGLCDRITSVLIARRDVEKPHSTLSPYNQSSSENTDA